MVTKEQLMNGLLMYADHEVIPRLTTAGKWGVGTAIILMSQQANRVIDTLTSNEIVKMLNVVSDDGLIDEERLSNALKTSAERYGNLQVQIPVLGVLTFNASDIDMLHMYITGGAV